MNAGIVPVKHLDRAKRRLGSRFEPSARHDIARALLDDALALCTRADFLAWWVVSDDDSVIDAAAQRGLRGVRDAGAGLNAALGAAVDAVTAAGATAVTVLPVDVPLATPEDVLDIVDTGATSDVVVVPSRDDGTNALYLEPPGAIAPVFGPGSLRAHVDAAAGSGLRCSILSLERLALDLDTSDDVDDLLRDERSAATATGRLLRALGPVNLG